MKASAILLIAILLPTALPAEDAYRWVDEDGIAQFSRWMPNKPDGVTRLRASRQAAARDYDPLADPYSIRNQAERMRETWKKTEQRRAERRKEREEVAERAARKQPIHHYPYNPLYPTDYRPPVVRPPVVRPPIYRPIHPPVGLAHRSKIQRQQVIGLRQFNARPHLRVPYSSVTGVSQRATIHRSPAVSPLSGRRAR